MHSKRKIPDLWWTDWKAKACTSFVLYLKVFKNHLYHLWHVRVLSIKPCLHTRLPEHNKSYRKVSRGWCIWSPGMDLWWGIWTAFRPREGWIWTKIFQKFKCPGGCPGGMLKLRFDWYIICTFSTLGIQNVIPNGCWSVTAITHKSQSNEKVTETGYHLKFSVQCGWQDEMMQWLIYMGLWQWCFYGDFNYE